MGLSRCTQYCDQIKWLIYRKPDQREAQSLYSHPPAPPWLLWPPPSSSCALPAWRRRDRLKRNTDDTFDSSDKGQWICVRVAPDWVRCCGAVSAFVWLYEPWRAWRRVQRCRSLWGLLLGLSGAAPAAGEQLHNPSISPSARLTDRNSVLGFDKNVSSHISRKDFNDSLRDLGRNILWTDETKLFLQDACLIILKKGKKIR